MGFCFSCCSRKSDKKSPRRPYRGTPRGPPRKYNFSVKVNYKLIIFIAGFGFRGKSWENPELKKVFK